MPVNYNPNTPYPLFFAWHGATDVAQSLLDTGPSLGRGFYRIKATFPEAIYVTAQGLVGDPGGVTGWPNTNGRDVALTRALVAHFQSTYCVDRNRIFSTGMSYGGMMSNLLACEMPDVFRAIGVMAGSSRGSTCGTNPVAGWFEHGDADMTVGISGGIAARDRLIQRNGCSTMSTQTKAMSDGITTCTIYNSCTSGNYPVVWCPIPGLGHSIASWAGTEMATFFRQF